ncbi:MAG: DUF4398 domain-containing protein [Candidatus Binatia bacterium]
MRWGGLVVGRAAAGVAVVMLTGLAGACAAPPDKELSTAQGAIDAARAAGAAEFASDDLAAAEQTLAQARTSVSERDYRGALAHALDAHLKAQAAARRGRRPRKARVAVDARLDMVGKRIDEVETHLASPEAKRMPAAVRRSVQVAITRALDALASARAGVERGELAVPPALDTAAAALESAAASLSPARPPRRTRGR